MRISLAIIAIFILILAVILYNNYESYKEYEENSQRELQEYANEIGECIKVHGKPDVCPEKQELLNEEEENLEPPITEDYTETNADVGDLDAALEYEEKGYVSYKQTSQSRDANTSTQRRTSPEHNWECSWCRTIIQQSGEPERKVCKEAERQQRCGGCTHNWKDLGEYGSKTYQCYYCDAIIRSNGTPRNVICKEAERKQSCGGCTHNWKDF